MPSLLDRVFKSPRPERQSLVDAPRPVRALIILWLVATVGILVMAFFRPFGAI
jgi:hypothetical protein